MLLKKDNITMEVDNEMQASVFLRNGYQKVEEKKAEPVKVEESEPEFPFMNTPEEPKKRGRRPNKQ